VLCSDLDVAEATDEPGRDARGDDSEQGDADQHQGAADQGPGSGRGVAIAVADGRDGGDGPPQGVRRALDVAGRRSALHVVHHRGREHEQAGGRGRDVAGHGGVQRP